MRWIKKSEGAISIFLCIIMTALIVLSGLLVDGSRIRTGQTQIQEAVNAASGSALTGYNRILKDVYGLFALAHGDEESLDQEIEAYLNKTLMTELGLNERNMDSDIFAYLKGIFTGSGEQQVNFLNLYDYRVENIRAAPLYNLSETNVLEGQLVDYMKYRAPKELLADGLLDKLKSFGDISKKSDTMEKKIETDKKLGSIRRLQEKLTAEITEVNKFNEDVISTFYNNYINHVREMLGLIEAHIKNKLRLEQLNISMLELQSSIQAVQSEISTVERAKKDTASLKNTLSELNNGYAEIQKEYSKLYNDNSDIERNIYNEKAAAEKSITSLRNLLSEFKGYNENAGKYIEDIIKKSGEAVEKIDELQNALKGDKTDFGDKISREAKTEKEQLDPEKLRPIQATLKSNSNLLENYISLIDSFRPDKLTESQIEPAVKAGVPGSDAIVRNILNKELISWTALKNENNFKVNYKKIDNFTEVKPALSTSAPGTDMMGRARSWANGNLNPMNQEDGTKPAETGNDALFNPKVLPSYKEGQIKSHDFSEEDKEYISGQLNTATQAGSVDNQKATEGDIGLLMKDVEFSEDNESEGFSENAFNMIASLFGSIEEKLKDARNNLYVNEYAIGMFNNALTDKDLSSTDLEKKGERDLRDRLKNSRTAYFDKSEVEYILAGMKNPSDNRSTVKGQILLIRFAMNTMHIYMDPVKNRQALAAATAIAGWTGFGVPIVHTLIMLSWAMSESILDVKSLLEGNKVPLMKTNATWMLSINGGIKSVADGVIDFAVDEVKDITKKAADRIDEIADEKISVAVDKIFSPVEVAIEKEEKLLNDSLSIGEDFLEQKLEDQGSSQVNELQKQIYEEVEALYKNKSSDVENILKDNTGEKARAMLSEIKKNIADEVRNRIKAIKDKINQEIEKTAELGKDKLKEYLESLEGTGGQKGITAGNSIKSSLLSLSYQDYLRVFLFIKNDTVKLGRIADLIQLNIGKQTNNSSFRMAECNTFIRVDAVVSMKYFFMTQTFMAKRFNTEEGSRYKFRTVLYQGY